MAFPSAMTNCLDLVQKLESALGIDIMTPWASLFCMNPKDLLSQISCLSMVSVAQAVRPGARIVIQTCSGLPYGSLKSAEYAMRASRRSGTTLILRHVLQR